MSRGWGGFGKVLGMKFSSHWRNEGRPADRALRSAAPPGTSVLNWKGKGFLLSLHLKCLHRKYFFPEFCPSKLLNPSLFLSPAPRTFRRPGPRWVWFMTWTIFFWLLCLFKTPSNFNTETTSKKMRKSRFLTSPNPPKTLPKSIRNRCSTTNLISYAIVAQTFDIFKRRNLENINFP